jgi:hypothetical protein
MTNEEEIAAARAKLAARFSGASVSKRIVSSLNVYLSLPLPLK